MSEGLVLTEVGETCQDRGLAPIGSLAECRRMTEFVRTYYPKYEFSGEDSSSKYPKGCYVWIWTTTMYGTQARGYFNNHWSGSDDLESRTICKLAEGMKQKISYFFNII